jgi:hypothetical protein
VTSAIVPAVANTSGQGQDATSADSGLQGGSNHIEEHPISQQGATSGLSNLKRDTEKIDRKRAAFKIEQ